MPQLSKDNPASGTDLINKSIDKLGFPTHFDMFFAHSMPSPSPTLRPRPQSHVTPRTWRVCATSAFLFRVADVPSLGCLRRVRTLHHRRRSTSRTCRLRARSRRVRGGVSSPHTRRRRAVLGPRRMRTLRRRHRSTLRTCCFTGSPTPRAWEDFVSSHTSPMCCLGSSTAQAWTARAACAPCAAGAG
jgi:hypothetical protein